MYKISLVFLSITLLAGCRDNLPTARESVPIQERKAAIAGVMAFRFALGETLPIDGCSVVNLVPRNSSFIRSANERYPKVLLFGRGGVCAAEDTAEVEKARLFVTAIHKEGSQLILVAHFRRGGSSHQESFRLQPVSRNRADDSSAVVYSVRRLTYGDFMETDVISRQRPTKESGANFPKSDPAKQ